MEVRLNRNNGTPISGGDTPGASAPNLAAAVRAARADDAERLESIVDLRSLALGRLALLRDALQPVLDQLPEDVDLFDVGLMPGDPPRLFIDMIAFVEMGRDMRSYRFLQDRRHGRMLLAEGETVTGMVAAVTAYIARRMVERDKALASDLRDAVMDRPATQPPEPSPPPAPRKGGGVFGRALWFVIEVIGLLGLIGLIFLGFRWLYTARDGWLPWLHI